MTSGLMHFKSNIIISIVTISSLVVVGPRRDVVRELLPRLLSFEIIKFFR